MYSFTLIDTIIRTLLKCYYDPHFIVEETKEEGKLPFQDHTAN